MIAVNILRYVPGSAHLAVPSDFSVICLYISRCLVYSTPTPTPATVSQKLHGCVSASQDYLRDVRLIFRNGFTTLSWQAIHLLVYCWPLHSNNCRWGLVSVIWDGTIWPASPLIWTSSMLSFSKMFSLFIENSIKWAYSSQHFNSSDRYFSASPERKYVIGSYINSM
jgi:hypothetical protein